MKRCLKCDEEKDLVMFRTFIIRNTIHRNGEGSHRPYCLPCEKQYRREHYLANKQRANDLLLKWRAENRERYLANSKIKNERYKPIRQTEEFKAQRRADNKRPERRAKLTEAQRLREAGIRKDMLVLNKQERQQIEAVYLEALSMRQDGFDVHVDHIVPLSKGGPHHPSNLQIIPAQENMRKGNRLG